MSELKVSVSGIRGVWGDTLGLDALLDYTRAFGRFLKSGMSKPRVLLGRDARPTGEMISRFTASALNALGIDVADCGVVPTPTILYGVRRLGLSGGVIVTASHNPVEWNAFKFVKKGGVFTDEADVARIRKYLKTGCPEARYDRLGTTITDASAVKLHLQQVLSGVDAEKIRARKFRVVLDPVNSAGGAVTKTLLEELGCRVTVVNGELTGRFARGAEPTPANLKHLEKIVRAEKADVAFAQDPDADRLVVIEGTGRVLSEEWTLALALENVLSRKRGSVVVNLSSSMISDHIAARYGCSVFRTKVGEANVVEGIRLHKALIGGEGNGGVIYPALNTARDSLVGIALVLELMALRSQPLARITEAFPRYAMIKEKFRFSGNVLTLVRELKEEFRNARLNTLDGVRLDWTVSGRKAWIHLRASNTEPVVRLIGEAEEKSVLDDALGKMRLILKKREG